MGTKRVIQYRRFNASLGSPIFHPTLVYEDNDAVISQVKQHRDTKNKIFRHPNSMVTRTR